MVNSLGSFVQSFFLPNSNTGINVQHHGNNQSGSAPVGLPPLAPGATHAPAFFLKGVYQPLCSNDPRNYSKAM